MPERMRRVRSQRRIHPERKAACLLAGVCKSVLAAFPLLGACRLVVVASPLVGGYGPHPVGPSRFLRPAPPGPGCLTCGSLQGGGLRMHLHWA